MGTQWILVSRGGSYRRGFPPITGVRLEGGTAPVTLSWDALPSSVCASEEELVDSPPVRDWGPMAKVRVAQGETQVKVQIQVQVHMHHLKNQVAAPSGYAAHREKKPAVSGAWRRR